MSKPKKKKPVKVYTISETIYVSFQVVATSEEDAQDAYRNLPTDKWQELVCDAASNNYCDDEVVDEEDFEPGNEDDESHPKTEKAKKAIFHNSSLEEEGNE
jgi:transcriptional regulator of met regulon